MKQLKYYHATSCTCHRTQQDGDFIIDIDYFKKTGELASLDDKVFVNLIDLFHYTNDSGIKTGMINSNVKPTYFEDDKEIKELIAQGKKVYWKNEGYVVSDAHNGLHVTFKHSQYYSKLQENEYQDCFVGV